MLILRFLVIFIIFKILIVYAANVQIKLEGLNDVLKFHIESKLSGITSNNNIVIDQYFRNMVHGVVYSGLRSLGYYSSTIDLFLYPSSLYLNKQENYILIVRVSLGEPIKISKVNINLSGDVCYDNDYKKLLTESQSYIGQILNHSKYDNFKNKLLNLSLSKGYFDSKFYDSKLIVIPGVYQSFWNIHFDSGQRYCFGNTRFYGGLVKTEYLKNLFHVRSGMYYDNQLLIELHRRLFATNWFHSVVISPNCINSVNRAIKSIPLDVFLVPAITNNIEFDLGYSSDLGSRFKIVWKNPCINSSGHSFKNIFSFSMLEQYIDLNFKIPLVCSPLEEYYLLKGMVKHESVCNKQFSTLVTMNISRYWDFIIGWNRGVNLSWCFNYCNELKNLKSMMLIYPGISIHRIRQRGGMMPVWGDSHCYSMDISSDLWHSNVNFFLLQSRNIWIRTFLNKNRVIIRNNLGWMGCKDFQSIFPFIREFFFVNNYLIRGYKYQFLFFKNMLLDQLYVPSKFLFSSLEYQYNFLEKWWGVLFFDAGNIVKNINNDYCYSFGTGVGIRWQSLLGPARLDFAVPLSSYFNKVGILQLLHIYVGLGPEL